MASQGPLYPGTVTTEAGPSGDNDWVNPSNVGANDGSEAQVTHATYDSGDHSYRLQATNFGFSIPTGATIDGIVVEIDRRCFAGSAVDNEVRLYNGSGLLVGDNKASATAWPATSAIATYGGSTDNWAAGLTAASFNSAFGVSLIVAATAANVDIGVDFVRVTVYYTEDTSIVLTPTPVVLDLALAAPTLSLSLALAPAAVPVDLGVLGATVDLVSDITLTPDPVLLDLAVPAPTLTQVLSLAPAPVALGTAVPASTVGVGALTLSPTPVPLGLAVPVPVLGLGALTLSPESVVLDLSLSVPTISTSLDLLGSPVLLSLGVLGGLAQESGVPIEVAPGPVALQLVTALSSLGLELALSPGAVPLSLATPASQVEPGALALQLMPVVLDLGVTEPGQVGPVIIVTGSSLSLVEEMLAYWEAYDALGTEAERLALLRTWLLEHGGRLRKVDNQIVLLDGLCPVRVQP